MGIFGGVLLASDLDGTLLDNRSKISKDNMKAMEYFMAEGGVLTFASGRTVRYMNVATDFILPNAPLIADNGSQIYDIHKKEYLQKHLLHEEVLPVMYDLTGKFPGATVEIYGENCVYIFQASSITRRPPHFVADAVICSSFNEAPFPWVKVVFESSSDEIEKMRDYAMAQPYYKQYNLFKSEDCFFEIINKNTSKGHALNYLKNRLPGIKFTVAVGDNENDVSMLRAAGLGYATENASSTAKAAADKITNHHTHSALAAVVRDIEKICARGDLLNIF